MKVCVSVNGCFHAMKLAYQLQKRGLLKRLITTYPKYYAERNGVERTFVRSLFSLEVAKRLAGKLLTKVNSNLFFAKCFDRYSARLIPTGIDIFTTWSGNARHRLNAAKRKGCITVLERGSTHVLFQQEILASEYDSLGIKNPAQQDPKTVASDIAEYEQADYIAIPSAFVKQTMLDQGISPDKLIVTPYGVNLECFYPHPKKDEIFRIIFCGNCCIRKGAHYLLQAFSELKLPNSELCFIGHVANEMESFRKKYAENNIVYLGSKPENELAQYYSQGSVFCLPSLEEGLALVIPQAMACELPIICSTNTGGADVIDDGEQGFIIPIRDVEALKQKILFCYEDRERCRNMGKSARQKAIENYTWDHYGKRVTAAYERILATR